MNNSIVQPPDKYTHCPHCKTLIVKQMGLSITKAKCPQCGGKITVSAKDIIERLSNY